MEAMSRLAPPLLLLLVTACSTTPESAGPGAPGKAKPATEVTRIAFASCIREDRAQPGWSAVEACAPDLLLLLGDNIYGDSDDPAVLRAKWNRLASEEGFRRVRDGARLLATWDDHDYGRNDAGADYGPRAESQDAFLDFLGVPRDAPRRQRPGVWHAETFGPPGRRVQVILLDTRFHRSPLDKLPVRVAGRGPYAPTTDRSRTVLGEEQWAWLARVLREPAEVRLLASSIQVLPDDHGWECWGNFPHERERLLASIAEAGAAGVVILSGDRHAAEVSVLDPAPGGGRLVEATSSAFNQSRRPSEEESSYRMGRLHFEPNFGLLEIAWEEAGDARLDLTLRSADGEVLERHTLRASELGAPPKEEARR